MVATLPLVTDPKEELMPINQKHGSRRHSKTCLYLKYLIAVVS